MVGVCCFGGNNGFIDITVTGGLVTTHTPGIMARHQKIFQISGRAFTQLLQQTKMDVQVQSKL